MEKGFDLKIKSDQFILTSKKDGAFCKSYIFEPTPEQRSKFGSFFVAMEIDEQSDAAENIFRTITSTFQREYYSHNGDPENNIPKRFEASLNKVNNALANLATEGDADWVGKFHAIIYVIHRQDLHLSAIGETKALLFRDSQLIEISQGVAPTREEFSPTKIFSNILTGALKKGDKLIVSTPALTDFLSLEKVKRIINQFSPSLAILNIKETLSLSEKVPNLAAVVIEIEQDSVPAFAQKKITPEGLEKEKQMPPQRKSTPERIDLQDKDLDYLKNYPNLNIGDEEPKKDVKKELSSRAQSSLSSTGKFMKGSALPFFKKIFRSISDFIARLFHRINKRKSAPRSRGAFPARRFSTPRRPGYNLPRSSRRGLVQNIKNKFLGLPRSSQIMIAVITVLILGFFISIVVLSTEKKEERVDSSKEELIVSAQHKEKEATDAMIYNDEDLARERLNEISKILSDNPSLRDDYPTEVADLETKIAQQTEKINHIIRIDDPIIAADVSDNLDVGLSQITLLNDVPYTFNTKANDIYTIDEAIKKLETLPIDIADPDQFTLFANNYDRNSILLYTNAPSINEFTPVDNSITALSFIPGLSDSTPTDLKAYGDKVYVLDKANNQIYKHERTIDGFTKGTTWVISEADLSDATSLAIDGDVYVLKSDGTILKFLSGELQDFNVTGLEDTPLENPTRIMTDLAYDNLYIIDPPSKRVIVLDKEGALVNQYTSDSFDDLKDIYALEPENKIYILNDSKILELVME